MDLGSLAQQLNGLTAREGSNKSLPPVEDWHPEFCGDMNLVIKASGEWWHEGTPFTRAKLVSLLSSVLKKEEERYFLVTPVEKIGIQVEDVPFVIIDWLQTEGELTVSTQIGDTFTVGNEHPIELREYKGAIVPYCLVRRNLWARLHQNVLYQWVDSAEEKTGSNKTAMILHSGDYQFSIGEY